MANKKISELPYINGGEISGNTLVPLVTYFSAATGDTVHTYITDLQNYLTSGITGNTVVVGDFLPLSGGTVTGQTFFTSGLTITGDTIITDNTGNAVSIDSSTRELADSNATPSINWDQRLLYDGSGINSTIDYGSALLYDTISTLSIDWGNRQSYDDSGTSALEWTSTKRRLYDSTATLSVDWTLRAAYDETGIEAFAWTTSKRKLLDITSADSVNWDDRILTKSDGVTISFDWENGILTGQTNIESVTISATTYQNLPIGFTGAYLPLSGGTVTGGTVFTSGLTASTLNISTTPTTDTGTTTNYLTRDGSTGEVKVKTIPGPTVYGLFSQTGTSVAVSATTVESTLINGGIGTLSVPANGFQVGDSFNGVLIGHLSCVGTATLQIRIKTTTGVVLADTGAIPMNTTTNKHWKLDVNFTIRQLGVASVGSIASGGLFSYTKNSGNNFEGVNFSIINNTTFDTTISNTLLITAEWNTNNAGNSIYSEIFTLNKTY